MHDPRFVDLVNEARPRVREITVAEVRARLGNGALVTLVDVREDAEWERGHLPGAVHLGKGILERDVGTTFPDPDQELILYCGGGYRSVLAADSLRRMGYARALSMSGGYRGWIEAGLPLQVD